MSNRLYNIAQRVRRITPIGRDGTILPERDLFGSEKAVLLALANDARDHDGGRSRLTTAHIAERQCISPRSIRNAYAVLVAAGHITREPGPPGAPFVTIVHPVLAVSPSLPGAYPAIATPPGNECHPIIDIMIQPIDHSPQAGAREDCFSDDSGTRLRGPVPEIPAAPVPKPEPEPETEPETPLPPVDQVFAAWDGWRDRAGLPGPVTRTAARRVAVDKAVRDHGLGRVLMMVGTVEREVRAGNFRRKAHAGQDTIWATFDAAFEVGYAAGLNLLARLLDGDFGALVPEPGAAPALAVADVGTPGDPDEPAAVKRLRAVLRDKLGARACAAWIDPLRFEQRGDDLVAVAGSAFAADYLATNYGAQLRSAAGRQVRISVKERV